MNTLIGLQMIKVFAIHQTFFQSKGYSYSHKTHPIVYV